MVQQTGYPYLSVRYFPQYFHLPEKSLEKKINAWSQRLFRRNLLERRPTANDAKVVFPLNLWHKSFNRYFSLIPHKIYWIADFQERKLPQLFDESELADRKRFQEMLARGRKNVVFSSNSAAQEFRHYYPEATTHVHVMPFAVTHPPYQHLDLDAIRQKYGLTQPYFFSPNQFWVHKNHRIVLEAIKVLSRTQPDFVVAFSGKQEDYRVANHFQSLQDFIQENHLNKYVRFLGFLDRDEQLKIMEGAEAIIQPSLSEGWSTVVEDAKAMNQRVLASNLDVHQEQLHEQGQYFDPTDASELAQLMQKALAVDRDRPAFKYDESVDFFAERFLHIVDSITAK
ncbi:Glycosyltransferase involved in cell wall bisynthesis [Catalinimonas alkaloidigena]|uniref:Glycosyltransferase involved in cell wall bisynthesis n=2 Tax=Catalinimonas alkaloidigena TaxID=1075417 RepID=A0A1G9LH77_9BACT|nr:Glycosyltransferase involved in cell wall bisynthesis [Catalinimonas alkaloidigena]